MIILTSSTSGTYKAQIRSVTEKGFKQLYSGTCTESEQAAARNLVRKWFGDAAAESVKKVTDGVEAKMLCGDFFSDPKRKQVFEVWSFNPKAPRTAKDELTPPSKRAAHVTVEVLTKPAVILSDASKALDKLRAVIGKHEETFAAATLGPRLQMGLQCLKAYQVFCIPDHAKRGALKGRKKLVTRDELNPTGFDGWLITEAQWLKRPTAYKYMTAVRGLGLDHTATEKQVAHALKLLLRKGPVSIKSLCDAALEAVRPPGDPDSDPQTQFDFLKDACSNLRKEVDSVVALKEQLDAFPDFKRVATARLYAALHDLTGTHWKPSDEPDALADIDPDAIKI